MGPAEGCVGGKSWVCHVDDHVVSLALVDNTHGPLISAVCRRRSNPHPDPSRLTLTMPANPNPGLDQRGVPWEPKP